MIRWKAFIPVTIIVVGIGILYFFFIDTIVKNIIIKTGQGIFDARVEVRDVDLSLKNSSLRIRGLVVANADEPMKNLFEAGDIVMDVQTLPLLSKKFIIDELKGEGITWGTARKRSGALPKIAARKKEKKKKAKKDKEDKSSLLQLPFDKLKQLGKKVDVKKMIDVENLAAVKEARTIEADIKGKKQQWETRIDAFKGHEAKLKTIQQDVEAVKDINIKTIADIPAAQQSVKKLQDAQNTLKSMKQDVSDAKKDFEKEFTAMKDTVRQLDALKQKDYKEIIAQLGFGDLSTGKIGSALFGPIIMSRINTGFSWLNKIREKLPKKKEKKEKKPERQRLKGIDILFPKKNTLPGLLVKKLSFSAQSPQETQGSEMKLSGEVSNITSNPLLWGKPVKLSMKGSFVNMRDSTVQVAGTLDYTTDIAQEKFKFSVKDIDLKGTSWKGGEYVPSGIQKGKGTAVIDLERKQNTMQCSLDAQAQNVAFETLKTDGDRAKMIMNDVFSSIDTLNIKGTIQGVPPTDVDISLSSNLDDIIAQKLKGLFGTELENQKAQVKKELDTIVDAKKNELLGDLSSKQKELEKKLLGSEGSVQERLDLVKNIIQGKESAIKSIGDEKKKEGQKQIQDNIQKQFKNLFK